MIGYYATALDDRRPPRVAWLAGPFLAHADALAAVLPVAALAEAHDPWIAFCAFGTTKLESDVFLPPGKFNRQLKIKVDKLVDCG